ncbi:hypothetical protein NSQ11_06010 [Bacillus sp. FSL W7-1582]|uniref:hypothetical protein n=1 Tax=Bacillus TaxID=1386 RepID=UPI0022DDAD12|nr:hypothetical protein [Bacillus altitudinis]WBL50359.1 hypothetical protein LOS13_12535 [Bacillus altitudinis]
MHQLKNATEIRFTLELEKIEKFYEELERNLSKMSLKNDELLKEDTSSLTEEEELKYYEDHFDVDSYNKYNIWFPQLTRQALFIQAFFIFEYYLNELCIVFKEKQNHKVNYKEMHGNGITRAHLYLSKICSIEKPFQTNEWKLIKDYNKVRNAIAHENGELNKDVNLKGFEKIEYNNSPDTFILEEDFVDNFLITIEGFRSKFYD